MSADAVSVTRPGRRPGRRRPILFLTLVGTIILSSLYLALGAALAWNSMRPKRHKLLDTPAQYSLKFESATFHSNDGTVLAAWYIPAPRHPHGVVILCHGIDGNRQAMLGSAKILHRAGFATLLFDFRARGESGGSFCTLGYREPDDLQAAVLWVEHRPDLANLPIGVLGASLGASIAIIGAARTPSIHAVVAEAPFSQLDRGIACNFQEMFGSFAPLFSTPTQWVGERVVGCKASDVSPLREIPKISPRPILIIEDAEDTLFPARETQALFFAAHEPKQIWTVPGAGHVGASYAAPEEYGRRITEFFAHHLQSAERSRTVGL